MKRNILLTDAALAVGLAAIVLIVAPGLAVVGIVAVLTVIVCGVTFGFGALRRRRGGVVPRRQARVAAAGRAPARRATRRR
jgi:UPF0716 family protein affecting phage T7 exclusion